MKKIYTVGSEEWKTETITSLTNLSKYLMGISKDMASYRLDCVIDQLNEYFKNNDEK
jgi:hypothetical protein